MALQAVARPAALCVAILFFKDKIGLVLTTRAPFQYRANAGRREPRSPGFNPLGDDSYETQVRHFGV